MDMFFLWKRLGCIGVCLGLLLAGNKTAAAGEEVHKEPAAQTTDWSREMPAKKLYSKSCALMDSETGRLLYGKEEGAARANASTTKILTCILALENGICGKTVRASRRAARQPRVRLGMREGMEYRGEDLLYCMMLESFNDCAVSVAEGTAGTVEAFAKMMNQKAKEIGCKNTYFITPNGLDDKDAGNFHHTTAEDLCRIMAYCVQKSPQRENFRKITGTKSYQFTDGKGRKHSLANHNRLLFEMQGIISGKTGFTADAGYCYVCAYEKDGRCLTAAFLGCGWPNNKNYKWKDARKIIGFAAEHYSKRAFFQMPEFSAITVEGCFSGEGSLDEWKIPMKINPGLKEEKDKKEERAWEKEQLLLSDKDRIEYRIRYEKIRTPAEKGQVIGAYEILLNQKVIRTFSIVTDVPIREWNGIRLFWGIFKKFIF